MMKRNSFTRRVGVWLLVCTAGVGVGATSGCANLSEKALRKFDKAAESFVEAAEKNQIKAIAVRKFEVEAYVSKVKGKTPLLICGLGKLIVKNKDCSHREIQERVPYAKDGGYLADAFVDDLVRQKSTALTIINRAAIEKILEEQEIQSGAEYAEENRKKIGKIIPSGAIVTGTVDYLQEYISVKMINIETGDVLATYTYP